MTSCVMQRHDVLLVAHLRTIMITIALKFVVSATNSQGNRTIHYVKSGEKV